MTIQKLEELISRSEYEKLDFKLDFNIDKESSKREFVKDVTAIANSKGGRGYIIFGVEDKKKEYNNLYAEGVTLLFQFVWKK